MKRFRFKTNTIWLIMAFSISSFLVQAQNENIIIRDSLSNKAEIYNIKSAKLKKLKFGEYVIVKAKPRWIVSTSHTTHRTYEEDIARQKFSFVLVNEKLISADVKAVYAEISQYTQSVGFLLQAATGLETTNYEGLNNSSNLSASIIINNNNLEAWNLLLEEIRVDDGKTQIIGSISNGQKTIYIKQVGLGQIDYIDNKIIELSPLRYEFIENEQSLGAMLVEYKNYTTHFLFKETLEPALKLILAATMTAIKETEFGNRFEAVRK